MKKKAGTVIAGLAILILATAGACDDKNIVDGKAQIPVPVGDGRIVICNLLEVETEDAGGEEVGEGYYCVSEAEWNKNQTGKEWVDANGNPK